MIKVCRAQTTSCSRDRPLFVCLLIDISILQTGPPRNYQTAMKTHKNIEMFEVSSWYIDDAQSLVSPLVWIIT